MRKNNKRVAGKKTNKTIDATGSIGPMGIADSYRKPVKPRSQNQKEYIDNISQNVITFCKGVAGSGKTHLAVGMALEYLLENKVKKIIITRPVVEAGEKIGYLPGSAEEKLHPYLLPLLDEVHHFISSAQYAGLKANNRIEIVPLGLMRGRNFHDCFVVADECQNASYQQLKMLLTRIGNGSKLVLTGDISQSDLHQHLQGGFHVMTNVLTNVDGISLSLLDHSDIVRNPIIGKILTHLDEFENQK